MSSDDESAVPEGGMSQLPTGRGSDGDSLVSVPARRYTSDTYARREWDRMWTRVWLLAAHVSEIPEPGNYVVVEIGRASIVLQRDKQNNVHGHLNVCQHRGMPLAATACGRHSELRCRYHQWAWELDGSLKRTPGVTLSEDQRLRLRLPSVRVEERLGFLWIALSDDVPSLDDWLAPVADRIATHEPERLVLDSLVEVLIDCNWKTSCDVSNESYHVASIHPNLRSWVQLDKIRTEILGPHSSTVVGLTELALPDREKVQFQLFPHVQLNFLQARLEVYRHRPHPDDPQQMYFDMMSYLRPGARSRSVPVRKRIRLGDQSLGPTMDEDVALLADLQRGMRSMGCREIRLSAGEIAIANFHRVLASYVGPDEESSVNRTS